MIMWGDEGRAVRAWLKVLGVDKAWARKIVALALRERGGIIRWKAAWILVIGILVTLAGVAVGVVGPYLRTEDGVGLKVPPVWATTLLGFVFGLYPICLGTARLILGAGQGHGPRRNRRRGGTRQLRLTRAAPWPSVLSFHATRTSSPGYSAVKRTGVCDERSRSLDRRDRC
jgi:hypothetical protein